MNTETPTQSPKPILILPPGTCDAVTRELLVAAGYIPLEIADPGAVRILVGSSFETPPNLLTIASLKALRGPSSVGEKVKFAEELIDSLTKPKA